MITTIKSFRSKSLYTVGLVLTMVIVFPDYVAADHPGIIGPVNHLGVDTVVKVIVAGLLDGINPSALGVLLLLVRRMSGRKDKAAQRSVWLYILGILLVYVVSGLLLRSFYVAFGPSLPVQITQILIAGLLFLSGLQELLTAFNSTQARFIKAPAFAVSFVKRFDHMLDKGFVIVIGMAVGSIELFATGAIYLSFIQAITYDSTAPLWVLAIMISAYLTAFLVPIVTAYSYRNVLAAELPTNEKARINIARAVVGGLFMLVALFIAASAIVTIQAIGA